MPIKASHREMHKFLRQMKDESAVDVSRLPKRFRANQIQFLQQVSKYMIRKMQSAPKIQMIHGEMHFITDSNDKDLITFLDKRAPFRTPTPRPLIKAMARVVVMDTLSNKVADRNFKLYKSSHRYRETDGNEVYFDVKNNGKTVAQLHGYRFPGVDSGVEPRTDVDAVMIKFHGNAENIHQYQAELKTLQSSLERDTNKKIDVVSANMPGYGFSTGRIKNPGDMINAMYEMVKASITDSQGHLRTSHIVLDGFSLGGSVAAHVAQKLLSDYPPEEYPNLRVDCRCDRSFTSINNFVNHFPATKKLPGFLKRIVNRITKHGDWDSYNPLEKVQECQNDTRFHFAYTSAIGDKVIGEKAGYHHALKSQTSEKISALQSQLGSANPEQKEIILSKLRVLSASEVKHDSASVDAHTATRSKLKATEGLNPEAGQLDRTNNTTLTEATQLFVKDAIREHNAPKPDAPNVEQSLDADYESASPAP